MGSPAPPEEAWTDMGGDGPPLVLTHANGFPPETYRIISEALTPHFPLVEGAVRGRDAWPDRSTVRASWSRKSVFKRWDSRVLDDYIEAGVIDGPEDSVILRYPKEWEARIFQICPHDEWANLHNVAVPTLVVRGETSDTLMPDAARRMAREMPDARVVELEGTSHFLPMEAPDEVARLVIDFAARRVDT